jgi:hypothetical protein
MQSIDAFTKSAGAFFVIMLNKIREGRSCSFFENAKTAFFREKPCKMAAFALE